MAAHTHTHTHTQKHTRDQNLIVNYTSYRHIDFLTNIVNSTVNTFIFLQWVYLTDMK